MMFSPGHGQVAMIFSSEHMWEDMTFNPEHIWKVMICKPEHKTEYKTYDPWYSPADKTFDPGDTGSHVNVELSGSLFLSPKSRCKTRNSPSHSKEKEVCWFAAICLKFSSFKSYFG